MVRIYQKTPRKAWYGYVNDVYRMDVTILQAP